MIYFDNAATSKCKPNCVIEAFEEYICDIGVSPGRGSYKLGVQASRMLYKTRKNVANFFGLDKPNVVFTKNSTEAINMLFCGILNEGDHVLITCYEHNAVLRPLHRLMQKRNIEYSIIKRDDLDLSPEEIYKKYCKENTKLFVSTLASNLTGRIVYRKELMEYMKLKSIVTFLDSSQGAGKISIDMNSEGIDYLAFTGHKDLLALPGIGGLCGINTFDFDPFIQGGTGVIGDEYINPKIFPESYEAGTLNMPAIWALNSAIDYLNENAVEINKKTDEMVEYLINGLSVIDNIIIYDSDYKRVSTVAFNVKNKTSSEVIKYLDDNEICARGGIHCAILAHEALGTDNIGAVRVSLNYKNSIDEIDKLLKVLREI